MNRLWMAMAMLAVLAASAWSTIDDQRLRGVTLIIIGFFAVKVYIAHRRRVAEERMR